MARKKIQIDVRHIKSPEGFVTCILQTEERDVRVYMKECDYDKLILDGFFLRNGKTPDSAGMLNTTLVYEAKKEG